MSSAAPPAAAASAMRRTRRPRGWAATERWGRGTLRRAASRASRSTRLSTRLALAAPSCDTPRRAGGTAATPSPSCRRAAAAWPGRTCPRCLSAGAAGRRTRQEACLRSSCCRAAATSSSPSRRRSRAAAWRASCPSCGARAARRSCPTRRSRRGSSLRASRSPCRRTCKSAVALAGEIQVAFLVPVRCRRCPPLVCGRLGCCLTPSHRPRAYVVRHGLRSPALYYY
mmetsp:Transcript_13427/g.44823  ORF Transcript_13427/g.44823 Transcript_13427/m.44823 type:complete len:227 (+) Transcript_13427:647-1327(+)